MAYRRIKSYNLTKLELKQIFIDVYCNPENPIYTFDGIEVQFHEDMFNHAFYESADRIQGDKSILSLNRCEKIYWIRDTLEDPEAILKQGWNKRSKSYANSRRVAVVKGNYLVVIRFTNNDTAKFVTAYEVNNDANLQKVLKSPDWVGL